MRNHNPVENTGIILDASGGAFLGSCSIFRYPGFVLTADHVVKGRGAEQLVVTFPGSRSASEAFRVRRITAHPKADLAILQIDPPNERDITWANTSTFDDCAYGVELMAFGYPQNWDGSQYSPMPRLFKGYAQRFFEHESHLGYKYLAVEMNFACPRGLSGSSVVNPSFQGRLYGVVSENVETSTDRHSYTEIDDDGRKYTEVTQNLIRYGLSVWLPSLDDWLNENVPPVSYDEEQRRAKNQHAWVEEERG